jgi:hypothetical protein
MLLSLALPWPCAAEWQFAPFIGYTWKGSTTLVDWENAVGDTHWNFGGAVTLIGDSPLGVEGYYVRTPGFFEASEGRPLLIGPEIRSSRAYNLMGNVVLATPRSWNRYGLRPFLSGGLGLMHASYQERIVPAKVDVLGMNIGGGATGFLSDHVGLRFDLRYFRNVRDVAEDNRAEAPTNAGEPVRLRYWTTSIGVVIKY